MFVAAYVFAIFKMTHSHISVAKYLNCFPFLIFFSVVGFVDVRVEDLEILNIFTGACGICGDYMKIISVSGFYQSNVIFYDFLRSIFLKKITRIKGTEVRNFLSNHSYIKLILKYNVNIFLRDI